MLKVVLHFNIIANFVLLFNQNKDDYGYANYGTGKKILAGNGRS